MAMKKLAEFISFSLLVLGLAGGANAAPIYDIVDWDKNGDGENDKGGRTAIKVTAENEPFTISHNVSFASGDVTINDLTLTLSHRNNKENNQEAWLVSDSDEVSLGELERSKGKWVDQEFILSASLYEGIFNGSWSIEFRLSEGTNGNGEGMWIDSSILSGNYDMDSDSDGVPDSNDECPDTPGGESVDEDGCSDFFLPGSPADNLPPHITRLTDFGSRPDWSIDGERILFLNGPVGDLFEIDINTREIKCLTDHYQNFGYMRALYLANGDILLCGPKFKDTSSDDPEEGRFDGVLWVLKKPFDQPAVLIDEPCWEGPTVSRSTMKIAWTKSDVNWNDFSTLDGYSEIWMGEIEYIDEVPTLVNKVQLLNRQDSGLLFFETQNFRPPNDDELIFSLYAFQNGEVMGLDLNTGEIRNYSNSNFYEEVEGIFPDGQFTAVERDQRLVAIPEIIDIWKLSLDGNSDFKRLTFFSDYEGFGANNPVVRDDARYMAFQMKDASVEIHGAGLGLFLFDLEAFETGDSNDSNDYFDLTPNLCPENCRSYPREYGESFQPSVDNLKYFTITQLTDFGGRPRFSSDGKKIAFAEGEFKEAYEINLETGAQECITCNFQHAGILRVYYLKDGDYLFVGRENVSGGRLIGNGLLWMPADKSTGPKYIPGSEHFEGIAISRTSRKIAYFTSFLFNSSTALYVAEITADGNMINKTLMDFQFSSTGLYEAQDFLLNDSGVGYIEYPVQVQFYTVDFLTGEKKNMTNSDAHEELEGLWPSCTWAALESNRHSFKSNAPDYGSDNIDSDVYLMKMDGTGTIVGRLSHFADTVGTWGNNPNVSPDGWRVAYSKGVGPTTTITGTFGGVFVAEFHECGCE